MALDDFTRGEIIGMFKLGITVRNIAKTLKIPKSTVQDIISLF